ncbi:hypothetical protein R6Q59_024792 [Mikania micrantha]
MDVTSEKTKDSWDSSNQGDQRELSDDGMKQGEDSEIRSTREAKGNHLNIIHVRIVFDRNLWFLIPNGNKKLFKTIKESYGIEAFDKKTKISSYFWGKGSIEISSNETTHILDSVYYQARLGRNVLSLKTLINQGFEVTFEGTMCVVTKPYMVFVEHKVKEDERAVEDYVNDERKSNIKWNDVDHIDNVSVLWNHFEQTEIKDRQEDIKKRGGKGKKIELSGEPEKVTTLEEMVTLLDLIEHVHISLLNKETLRKRFDEMVKWFIKGVLKQSSSWPPIIDNQVISLYDLYLSVRINGRKEKVSINNFWILLAADLGLDSRKGYKLMFIYNEYFDPMEWFYQTMKNIKEQQVSYTFEEGESSAKQQGGIHDSKMKATYNSRK